MAQIRPVSDLQRKIGELTKLAKDSKEPIYLTRNGVKHLVLIDAETFDELLSDTTDRVRGK
ncbi:MAG: type II toxin-antitoxin system Phd/YefM family antitoxin [Atopobiaceae bacterium]|jgi:prevent-host-death family protein|nr:type II toxin-antitoxin system Phd/YefM family antitoxin [Atopobiaceae bacterium]MCI2172997.1 type II toxin-antitoxin system Phd/YefM family antitoxin [Atopobiaceae bacterium]MCI2208089.1 type II toxin-antitoxin system Phd/YefM family antitoxin [Atopobiaceae bacterium]